MKPLLAWSAALLLSLCACDVGAQGSGDRLVLEAAIPLPAVTGRIDHMALDLAHQRLFVAALGAGSLEAVDLSARRVAGRVTGLKEPQGVAYLPGSDEVVVACADGSVRFYRGRSLAPTGLVDLGEDADNVRVDATNGSIVVGYGDGALAVIDPAAKRVTAKIPLPSHPEGFRLDAKLHRAFVNLPGSGSLATADLQTGKVTSRRAAYAAGYPLQFDPDRNRVLTVYRLPARLVATDPAGAKLTDIGVCGDADDLFLDGRRKRIYVSCGSGAVDVLDDGPQGVRRLQRIHTRSGARTSLFAPELDRLYVAARESGGKPAAILVFRPAGDAPIR